MHEFEELYFQKWNELSALQIYIQKLAFEKHL